MISQLSLQTHRPLIFFDLETTGVKASRDRIVEIAAIKFHLDRSVERLHHIINPGIPIPKEASDIHGITDEEVKDKPSFQELSAEIQSFFSGSDMAGFNVVKFDILMLHEELVRAGQPGVKMKDVRVVDACSLYFLREPRNLEAAVKFYTGSTHDDAHSALADVEATINVLEGQLRKYPDLIPSVESLHNTLWGDCEILDPAGWFGRRKDQKVYFLQGKHKGRCVEEHQSYLDWMRYKAEDMSETTKKWVDRIRQEIAWRTGFRNWFSASKVEACIPNLDAVLDCIESMKSCELIEVIQGDGEVHITLRCGSERPVELLINCLEQKGYLIDYIHYAMRCLEKGSIDTSKYGLLLSDVRKCLGQKDPQEGLVDIHSFINKGLKYCEDDFRLQRRFKELMNGFKSTRSYVSGLVEASDFQANDETLRNIYNEGISGLCLDLEMFFEKHEKQGWENYELN